MALLLGLALWMFSSVLGAPGLHYIGLGNDPVESIWFLKWMQFALLHHHNPLYTNYIGYPAGVNLMWNGSLVLQGLLFLPWTTAFGAISTYNAVLVLGPVVSGAGMFVCLRHFRFGNSAAAAGALLYAFCPYIVAHSLGHPHLTWAFGPPLTLAAGDEALIRQRRHPASSGVAIGLLTTAQIVLWEETLALEFLAAVVAVAVAIIVGWRRRGDLRARVIHAAQSTAWAVATALLTAGVFLGYQFFGKQPTGGQLQPANVYVTDAGNLISPTIISWFSAHRLADATSPFTGNLFEWTAYLGVPLIVLIVCVVIVRRRDPPLQFALAVAAILLILSMGPQLHVNGAKVALPMPWNAVQAIPLIGIALPARLTLELFVFVAMLVALFVQYLRSARPWKKVCGGLLVIAVAISWLPRHPFPTTGVDIPPFFRESARTQIRDGSIAMIVPYPSPEYIGGELWQVDAGLRFRQLGGYFVGPESKHLRFGGTPTPLSEALLQVEAYGSQPDTSPEALRKYLSVLSGDRVETVILGPAPHPFRLEHFLESVLGVPPVQSEGVAVWFHVDDLVWHRASG